ncbi:MAG: proline/glycine betaine ABC transporter permease [Spirochaetales bacterium]|nr:proline/glycine betaine ABC transporter permease [Spirochaetales bacterium]
MRRIPKIPLGEGVEALLDVLTDALSWLTRAVSTVVEAGIDGIVDILLVPPPWVLIVLIAAVAWRIAGRGVAIFGLVGLLFVWNLELWDATVSTLALVLISTLLAILVGLPLGIAAGLNDRFYVAVKPVLDFMQTMPAFVYLIPAIPFFGLGPVSAVFATVIFSVPPSIRLTSLGIRQIDRELIEASDAFGTTTRQKLFKVQMPLAMPTIMAGVNQTIMLALSMVVISAMIGAGGLGGEVWRAIQRLQPGRGFEAGIAVVIVAMVLDRITQSITKKGRR